MTRKNQKVKNRFLKEVRQMTMQRGISKNKSRKIIRTEVYNKLQKLNHDLIKCEIMVILKRFAFFWKLLITQTKFIASVRWFDCWKYMVKQLKVLLG